MKEAIILGATGLVGSALLKQLLDHKDYTSVKIFVRRSSGIQNSKLKEFIVNFDKPEDWKDKVKGDVLFSAFGTTLKTAGSKEAQYKIDYTYQYQTAKAAADNGVKDYVLVSAAGSSTGSLVFYSRMKGELERDVKQLPFQHIHIMRPGLLAGDRKEKRLGEEISYGVLKFVSAIPGLGSLRPVQDHVLAKAMIQAVARQANKINTYSPADIFRLANKS